MKMQRLRSLFVSLVLLGALGTGAARAVTAPTVTNLPPVTDRVGTPVRLAGDTSGNLYLTDPRAGGILVFGNDGKLLRSIATLKKPQGIAVTAAGDLVVSQGTSVSVLSPLGVEKFKLGAGAGQFKMANGIAIDNAGYLYVVDSLDNCVQVFTSQGAPVALSGAGAGKPLNSFGSAGKGNGQFSQPSAIAFEPASGQLAVVDTLNSRVQFFTTTGSFVKSIGSAGLGSLKFGAPQGVAFGATASGTVMYVVDTFQSNIQAIDLSSGTFLRVIGSYGKGSGKLVVPTDLLFDNFDARNPRLVVANGFGNLTLFGIEIPAGTGTSGNGPALSINTLPLATNLTSLTISGTVAANATVKITPSTSAAVGAVSGGVTWSATVTGLVAGTNQFTVTATDNASGASTSTLVSVFVTSSGSAVTPFTVNALPSHTATAAQTLSGTVQPGSTVTVNGNPATVSGGTWSYPTTLTQGLNTFQLTAANASFSSANASINITLNSVVPLLDVALLPTGSTTSNQLLTISGTVSDLLPSTVQLTVNGQALPALPVVNGSFSTGVFLQVGSNSIDVKALDSIGNQSATVRTSITFAPTAPLLTIGVPDGSSVPAAALTLTGSVSAGSTVQVSVAGVSVPVTVSGTSWSAPVTLAPGTSTILATATLGSLSSTARSSVSYDPGAPALTISAPSQNAVLPAGTTQSVSVTGTTTPGSSLLATLDGTNLTVSVAANGAFAVPLGNLAIGSHTLSLTALDALGNSASALRSIVVADPTPPPVTLDATNPLKLSVGSGATLVVRDKNGPVAGAVTTQNGVSTLDLSGASYDPATLSVTAVTPTGATTRNGVLTPTAIAGQVGVPAIGDALEALKIATGARPAGLLEKMHGDVAPLANGTPLPDGKIDIEDVVVIMMRVVGKPW
ncbi:hypothetical protein GMST_01170 [Geomonas silvestris]|uniref:Bacterial Ig domain-containing protein n=1 Tax=Geomonas silvestris TaxID=2740184 RepID=A0A6V8MCU9_9BACT|nr:Ig-like domain-containing protein [Geomonas silvestris]GFO57792.1 hypothetical protein GMST_01170 [Geomonas silvestris]